MTTQTGVVSKFASLLGTKTSNDPPPPGSPLKTEQLDEASRELLMCISKSVGPDDVVCTLPSLDMRKLEQEDSSPLPEVGKHFPKMEASVLKDAAEASAKEAQVEEKAAQNLGSLTSWTRSSVIYASKAISENAANSFTSLVESRVRAWTLLLLRHSLTGDSSSRSRLLNMLESIIKVKSAELAFKPVPMSASVANMEKGEGDPDVVLPMIAEVHLNIAVHDKNDTVKLRAPGTISAHFDKAEDGNDGMGLKIIDLGMDTRALLEAMVKEARMVVFNAVAKATNASKSLPMDSSPMKNEGIQRNRPSPLRSGFASTSVLGSSLKLSPSQARMLKQPGVAGQYRPSHRSMKAHNSSLKLNKVLSSAAMQKTRSVQFGRLDLKAKGVNIVPESQRLANTTKLTSFKSFGRPHAGDFGSDGGPKNATFANFGGGGGAYWGRNGKLASKPRPMLPSETQDMLTSQVRRNQNATFDTKPPIHLSRSTGLGLPQKKKASQGSSSIPRTATAAEGWLLESMKKL